MAGGSCASICSTGVDVIVGKEIAGSASSERPEQQALSQFSRGVAKHTDFEKNPPGPP
jgi:hypothetical protein